MPSNSTPDIFLSYSWANTNVADEIDNDFKTIGITFRRDVRDAPYRSSIKEFMQQIGKSDFVLMLISDEYLRSENCLYEVTELLNTHEFEKRILPIVLDNARHIFKAPERVPYYDYWRSKHEEAEQFRLKHANLDYVEHARKYTNILNHLDLFFQKITDLNVPPLAVIKNENYGPMLKLIGFEKERLLEEAIAIGKIKDPEERDLALEAFLVKHPDNKYGLFVKASIADDARQYKKAKSYYEYMLMKYPDYALAHFNLAILLTSHFLEHQEARRHYEEAIRLDPRDADIWHNLAHLLADHFSEYQEARRHYEEAIRLEPQHSKAHNNLALLFTDQLSDHNASRLHYEKAIQFDPQYATAYYNLANLLNEKFFDHKEANHYYKEALRLNPQFAAAHYNLANLIREKFSDYKGARFHYEEAIRLTPQLTAAHNNLGLLLADHFSDHAKARYHYEEALRLNPQYAKAHYNYAVLLKEQFSETENAQKHYLAATAIDASIVNQERDTFFGVTR